ncbi:unnamed protein product [Brassica oleracea]
MVKAVEKKVGITTKRKGTSSQNTTFPPKPTLEPGVKLKSCICFVSCMSEHVCFVYSVWILYIENVNGTNAGRKSWRRIKVHIRRMLDIRKRGMLLWHFAVQRAIILLHQLTRRS